MYEKQVPNLKITPPSPPGFTASCYSRACSCQPAAAAERPTPAGNRGIYDRVPAIDLCSHKMPSFSRHSTAAPLWEPVSMLL